MDDDSDRQFGGEKIFQHLGRLHAWQDGKRPPPVTVELDLTNLCNHGCPDCSFSYLVNVVRKSIDYRLAQDIVRELGEIGVKAVTFSGGGEPLLYGEDKVLSLMRDCRAAGMDVGLITNGSKITQAAYLDLCTWVRVSLDGYNEATFARFHGRGQREFDKCVDAVSFLCDEAARRKRYGQTTATVGVGFLTDDESVARKDFAKMSAFCSQINGLDYLQFRPLVANMVVDGSLTGGYAAFTDTELSALRDDYTKARAQYARDDFRVLWSAGKYHALAQSDFGKTYSRCHGQFLEATISADSKVYVCCHTQGQADYCLGDLTVNTFAEIWWSDAARKVVDSFDPRDSCPPACRLHLQNRILHQIASGATHRNFI